MLCTKHRYRPGIAEVIFYLKSIGIGYVGENWYRCITNENHVVANIFVFSVALVPQITFSLVLVQY